MDKCKIFIAIEAGILITLCICWNSNIKKAFALSVNAEQSEAFFVHDKEQKIAALTFDDGPHPVYTPKLLEGLKKRNTAATFFLIGENIDGNEAVIKQMEQDGHLIGNHTHSHIQLTSKKWELACKEIDETNQKIYQITGKIPEYIRPPFGSWNDELECQIPMTPVFWTIDPLDWKCLNTKEIVRYVCSRAENGSIILLHDVYGTSVDAALEIIDTLTAQGYTFVTADELLID